MCVENELLLFQETICEVVIVCNLIPLINTLLKMWKQCSLATRDFKSINKNKQVPRIKVPIKLVNLATNENRKYLQQVTTNEWINVLNCKLREILMS